MTYKKGHEVILFLCPCHVEDIYNIFDRRHICHYRCFVIASQFITMDTIGVNLFVSSIGTFSDHSNHYLNGITRLFKTLLTEHAIGLDPNMDHSIYQNAYMMVFEAIDY